MNNVKTGLSTQNDIDGSTINSDDCDKHFLKICLRRDLDSIESGCEGMKPPKSKPAIESGALIESASISKRPAPLKQQNKKHTYKHTCWRNTKITKKYKTTLKLLI